MSSLPHAHTPPPLAHEQASAVAQGLAAMAHRSADREASLVAMEALRGMLDSPPNRPMLVASIPAGERVQMRVRVGSVSVDGCECEIDCAWSESLRECV